MKVILLSLILIVTPFFITAQFKNIMLDIQDESSRAPTEPSVSINMKGRDNIIGAAILDKIHVTKDGGKACSKSRMASSMGVWGDPVVIPDSAHLD